MIALPASNPFAHSPTTTTSECAPRYSRRSERAGASSSTSSTRRASATSGLGELRAADRGERQRDAEHVARSLGGEPGLARAEHLEATAYVLEPDPLADPRRRVRIHGILHRHAERCPFPPGVDANDAAREAVLDAVLDGVLDQRLEEQRPHAAIGRRGVHHSLDAEALAEAELLDVQIALDQDEFLPQRDVVA